MLRCPERHEEGFLVLSTGEMLGRMVRSGMLGCPVCGKEYPIVRGVAHFSGGGMRDAGSVASGEPTHLASRISHPADVQTLQALLDLSGPVAKSWFSGPPRNLRWGPAGSLAASPLGAGMHRTVWKSSPC